MAFGEFILTLFKEHASFRIFLAVLFSLLCLLPAFLIPRDRRRYIKAFLLPLRMVARILANIRVIEDIGFYAFLLMAYLVFMMFILFTPVQYMLLVFVIIGGWAILGSLEAHNILKEHNPDKDQEFFNLFLVFLSLWISQVAMLLSYWLLLESTNLKSSFSMPFSAVFTSVSLLIEPLIIGYAILYSIEAIRHEEDPTFLIGNITRVWKRPRREMFK